MCWKAATRSFPIIPHEARNFRLSMKSADFMKVSSEMRQPAEKLGKYPKRSSSGKIAEPSIRMVTCAIYLPL